MTEDLFATIERGDAEGALRLVQANPTLFRARSAQDATPVLHAAYHRQGAVLDALLSCAPELDLFEAAAAGQAQRVRQHLEGGQSVDARARDGFTPLHLACFFARPEVVSLLLERGADANAEAANPSRLRPLHSAAAARRTDIARALLERGADVNATQQGGWTALHAAAMHGEVELARLLIEHGAQRSAQADDGKTASELANDADLQALLR